MRTRSRANVASNETGNQAKSKAKTKNKSTPIIEQPLDKEQDKLTKGKRKANNLNDDREESNAKVKKSTATQSSQSGSRKRAKTQNEKASVLQKTKEKEDVVESQVEVESESKSEAKPSKAPKSTRKTTSKVASKAATKGPSKSRGKKVTTGKEDTKKEVKETQNETLETSKLSRSTRGKTAASTSAVSKPASRSRATKQTSPKKAEASDSSQSTQPSLDEEASKTNASNKSSSKSKTSKKAASHKLTKESESIQPTRSSKTRASTQVKTKPSEVKEASVTDVKSTRASKKTTSLSKLESSSESETSTGRKTRTSKRVATATVTNLDEPKTKITRKQKTAPKPKPEKVTKSEPSTRSSKTRGGKRGGKVDQKKSGEEEIKEMEVDEEESEGVARLSTVPEESEEEVNCEMVDESKSAKHTEKDSQKVLKTGQEIQKASTKEILPTVLDVLESIKDKLETTLEREMRQDNEKRQERENNSTLDDDETSMDANVDQDSIQGTFEEEKITNGELKKNGTAKRPKGTIVERKDVDNLSSSSDSNLENKIDNETETVCSKRKSSELEDDIQVKDKLIKKAKLEVTEPDFTVGGHLMTFGDDICGELGQKVIGLSKKRPVFVEGINDKVAYIAVGAMHNVCITSKNQVYTFGCNDEGALGRDTSSDSNLESKPLKVPISVKVIKVTAGDSHTAALTSLGGVYLWGNFKDPNGSIGLTPDSPGSEIHPIHIPAINMTFVDIASGGDHLLLLSDAGKVYSLGVGEQGQLGRFKPEEAKYTKDRKSLYLTPHPVQFSEEVECDRVWAGNYSSFARSKDGKVYAWGLNNYSQLGYKTSENELIVPYPKCVTKFTEIGCTVEEICSGQHHSIARDSNGRVYSFGRNEYGRLGHGQTGHDEDVPRMIESLKGVKIINIATGSVCSFAISETGHLYSWGMGAPQLGIGDGDLWEPTQVISSVLEKSRVLKVSSGAQHTAIIVDFDNSERNRK